VNTQPGQPGDPGGPQGPPQSEEELQAAFEEQMRQIKVDDVLLQTAATLINLGARRLGLMAQPGEDASAERDLGQARTAIEAVRALLPLCPAEPAEQLRAALSQLQMAYARDAGAGGAPSPDAPAGEAAGPGGGERGSAPDDDAERAAARAKIWTPPGT
jgi:hypothetical protein